MTITKDQNNNWLIDGKPGDPTRYQISISDHVVTHCVGASDSEGWVDVMVLTQNPKTQEVLAVAGPDGKLMIRRYRGSVKITDKPKILRIR